MATCRLQMNQSQPAIMVSMKYWYRSKATFEWKKRVFVEKKKNKKFT